jgi:hypothetical protein
MKRLGKLGNKWSLIVLIVLLVALLLVLFVKTPYPEIYLNETISFTGELIRILVRFFSEVFG